MLVRPKYRASCEENCPSFEVGYDSKHDELLNRFIERRIGLFSAVGVQCELWEEIMDELVVGETGEGEWHVDTTSHPRETVAEVLEFVKLFDAVYGEEVEIIEV